MSIVCVALPAGGGVKLGACLCRFYQHALLRHLSRNEHYHGCICTWCYFASIWATSPRNFYRRNAISKAARRREKCTGSLCRECVLCASFSFVCALWMLSLRQVLNSLLTSCKTLEWQLHFNWESVDDNNEGLRVTVCTCLILLFPPLVFCCCFICCFGNCFKLWCFFFYLFPLSGAKF